jgi:hypothetical protein
MWILSSFYNGLHDPSRRESWNIGIWNSLKRIDDRKIRE